MLGRLWKQPLFLVGIAMVVILGLGLLAHMISPAPAPAQKLEQYSGKTSEKAMSVIATTSARTERQDMLTLNVATRSLTVTRETYRPDGSLVERTIVVATEAATRSSSMVAVASASEQVISLAASKSVTSSSSLELTKQETRVGILLGIGLTPPGPVGLVGWQALKLDPLALDLLAAGKVSPVTAAAGAGVSVEFMPHLVLVGGALIEFPSLTIQPVVGLSYGF